MQDQFWYLYPKADLFSATHGSPYEYDTYVPIMVAGPGAKAQTVSRPAGSEDIAAMLAAHLGIKPPSGSVGRPLDEALRCFKVKQKATTVQK